MKTIFAITIGCCLAASTVLARPADAEAIIVKGSVISTPPQQSISQPIETGATVEVGSTITTGNSSDVLLSAFPGSAIRVLEENTVILVESVLEKRGETILGRKAVLNLQRGAVQVALEKREDGPVDFKVSTPQCVAAARGTVFSCSTAGDATTTVVLEGTVVMPTGPDDGKTVVFAVGPGQRGVVRKTPEGLYIEEGPFPATRAELAALRDFVEVSAAEGLIIPPVGELIPPTANFNLNEQVLPPVVTDLPVSP